MAVWSAGRLSAAGLAVPQGGGVGGTNSSNPHQRPQGDWCGLELLVPTFSFNKKTGKILNEKTGKNLHKFNQNEASKSRLKSNAIPG